MGMGESTTTVTHVGWWGVLVSMRLLTRLTITYYVMVRRVSSLILTSTPHQLSLIHI